MNISLIITLGILIVSIILFLSDRIRPDLIAISVALSLGIAQILTPQETFSGFSRSAIFTLIGIFIMAEGLRRTGVTEKIGWFLIRIAGSTEKRLTTVVILSGALLSLFMNNIAAASVLLPAVMGASEKSKVKPSKLLIPLAFGTILGGTATLLTTMNIIVNSLLRDRGLQGFGLLDFAPLGIPIVIAGTLYIVIFGRKTLPANSIGQYFEGIQLPESGLPGVYRLGERLTLAIVNPMSPLVGVPLDKSQLRESFHLNLIAVKRRSKIMMPPSPIHVFQSSDVLLLEGRPEDFSNPSLQKILQILTDSSETAQIPESSGSILFEAVLAPRSQMIGKNLKSIMFREKFNTNVLAIWRAGTPIRTRLTDLILQFGDTLLIQGAPSQLRLLQSDPDLIVLANKQLERIKDPLKANLAILILLASLIMGITEFGSVGEVMFAGAILMVLFGIITMDQAYQAIDWRSIFLVAGMLPMGVALTKTGAASLLADQLYLLLGNALPIVTLATLFIIVTLFTQAMSGAAVAAIMAPIAIEITTLTRVDPRSFAMGVAIATSMAFMTPLGHPVNILVMGPGGYKFRDYLKIGVPLSLLLFIVVISLLPVFWPFY